MTISQNEDIYEFLSQAVDTEIRRIQEINEKYPSDVPNEASNHAFIYGYSVENSFGPKQGDYNYLCKIGSEKLFLWTYEVDTYSALVSEVDPAVKRLPYWKTASNLIWLSSSFFKAFEYATMEKQPDYKWMYYFSPKNANIEELVFKGLSNPERNYLSSGTHLKATDIAELAPIIELLLRDDTIYTALSLVYTAFCIHPCCLLCEMSNTPWHDHLAEEPEIWKHAEFLPKLEIAVVQSCRAVEAIIGEPPSQKKQGKVFAYKKRWESVIGIDPDEIFDKAGMSYLDFYYKLFFKLRNPSAHSYGDIHYDLARKRAVEAQCFAAEIIRKYINKNSLNYDVAINNLEFNRELLERVHENMSTCITAK